MHEQSRPDRDEYIQIFYQNMDHSAKNQFDKYDKDNYDDLDAPYDTCSVMHYRYTTFSKDGRVNNKIKNISVSRQFPTVPDYFRLFQTFSDFSDCFRLFQTVSDS